MGKMLKHSDIELDSAEMEGFANAIMDISSDLSSLCNDLQPDEFDDMKEIDTKISHIEEILNTAKAFKEKAEKAIKKEVTK
jgi:Fic family protein